MEAAQLRWLLTLSMAVSALTRPMTALSAERAAEVYGVDHELYFGYERESNGLAQENPLARNIFAFGPVNGLTRPQHLRNPVKVGRPLTRSMPMCAKCDLV